MDSIVDNGKLDNAGAISTVWPSGLRRYVQVVVLSEGVGSNPTAVKLFLNSQQFLVTTKN